MQAGSMISSRLLQALRGAKSVAVLTGAGISAESGIPTFRGNEGLWKKFKPEELASVDAFLRNPDLVWEWYAYRKHVVRESQPNAGHRALVDLEALIPDVTVITQNVDNLHQRAGSKNVVELHGNITRNFCNDCGARYDDEAIPETPGVPRCQKCGGLIRPAVVWFGELIPPDQWRLAETAARRANVFFSVGTSGIVYPAASLPLLAKDHGAYVVEINTEITPLSDIVDETIIGKAGDVLPEIVAQLRSPKADFSQ